VLPAVLLFLIPIEVYNLTDYFPKIHLLTVPKIMAGVIKTNEVGTVNMELQLDATITVLLISKISSTCFGQTFAHLQERKT
jgi:hypothetical protein